MNLKKLLLSILLISSLNVLASDPTGSTVKFYGYVGNEFFYNSRLNQDMVDGAIFLFPKPVVLNLSGNDANALPQAEMLSVNTRLGVDFTGNEVLGAKTTAKIEADFAGDTLLPAAIPLADWGLVQERQARYLERISGQSVNCRFQVYEQGNPRVLPGRVYG